jgi:conjugative relaxase-like TrwC/TraI family protein
MVLHKLTAGDGYTYLTRHVAGADVARGRGQDAADYYTAEGNPPGRWIGDGLKDLGLHSSEVTEEQMRNLYGVGRHPDAERITEEYLTAHLHAELTDAERTKVLAAAERAGKLGAQFPFYQPLDHIAVRLERRLAAIREETGREPTPSEIARAKMLEARAQRSAVAGYDLVFSPVKSAAVLWALHPESAVRDAVHAAHRAALDSAMTMLESHVAFTRKGRGGIAQIKTAGLIAVAFDHHDSRAGDPNPHTHVVIANKVRGADGIWRSLDARALYRATVAVSEHYQTAFETDLAARVGASFSVRAGEAADTSLMREIDGIPGALTWHFSSRRSDIEDRYAQLVRGYRREHGYEPGRKTAYQLARQATIETRQPKKHPRSLAAMREAWRLSAVTAFGPDIIETIAHSAPGPGSTPAATLDLDVPALAASITATMAEKRSTWTEWNLRAEAERNLRTQVAFPDITTQINAVDQVVAEAISPRHSLRVDAPSLTREPAELRREDGSSIFDEHRGARYTSPAILDAETRLLYAAQNDQVQAADPEAVRLLIAAHEKAHGRALDPGQRALVEAFAANPRRITVGIGPAGSGKTTAMAALADVLSANGTRLVPLATSSAAASILGAEIGVKAENLHKFLHEYTHGTYAEKLTGGGRIPPFLRHLTLNAGDLLLVDEAGLAGTPNLDRLLAIAVHRGARIALLGDPRQLGAIESGGALSLLAHDAGAAQLTTLYRFHNPHEAEATLKLAAGDTSAIDFYAAAGRIRSGSRDGMVEAAYQGWKTDMLKGRTTILPAGQSIDVTRLSAQARADRVTAGQVEPEGVLLRDGNTAGIGDWIITRRNDRKTTTHGGREFLKNGDTWTVVARHDNGALTVENHRHKGRVSLTPEYVAQHVQLYYAAHVMRSQGSTVDTAHPLVTEEMTREQLYVAASRAKHQTTLYVATHDTLPLDEDDRLDYPRNDPRSRAASEVLQLVIGNESAEKSATETIRESQNRAASLATLAPRFQYVLEAVARPAYYELVHENLDHELARRITSDPAWAQLRRSLIAAEQTGQNATYLLHRAAERINGLEALEEPAAHIDAEINAHLDKIARRAIALPLPECASRGGQPGLPPWLTVPPRILSGMGRDQPLRAYLRETQELMADRLGQLISTDDGIRHKWSLGLLSAPQLSAALAYRDQFGIAIATGSPGEPLGPHRPYGDPAQHAYRIALSVVCGSPSETAATAIGHPGPRTSPVRARGVCARHGLISPTRTGSVNSPLGHAQPLDEPLRSGIRVSR